MSFFFREKIRLSFYFELPGLADGLENPRKWGRVWEEVEGL